MTALVCSDLIQSAYTQQSITFHLHITAPRCSKRLKTITTFVNLINFTLPVEYATASTICLRWRCRYHVSIVWIVVHAVIHVTRRHLTTYDVTHLCHHHKGIRPWESSHGWSNVAGQTWSKQQESTSRNFSVPLLDYCRLFLHFSAFKPVIRTSTCYSRCRCDIFT